LQAARKSWVVGPYSYYSQFRYNPNNEPDLHTPWMYTLMGQPWKTTTVLRAAETAVRQRRPTASPATTTWAPCRPGTCSARWACIRRCRAAAASCCTRRALPAPRSTCRQGRTLHLQAPGADGRKLQYVQGVQVDGQAHAPVWLDWNRLQQGGTIAYTLGDKAPEAGWGTRVDALPVSYCATPGATLE
jgi:putative alpha-1,2-mannosidase